MADDRDSSRERLDENYTPFSKNYTPSTNPKEKVDGNYKPTGTSEPEPDGPPPKPHKD